MKTRTEEAVRKATHIVHWPTGPVYACGEHAKDLVHLGKYLGSHIVATICFEDKECSNCINAAKV